MNESKDVIRDYFDIIDLPRPVSIGRPRMPARDRAAQFLPFAALSGYDAAVRETERRTDERAELSDDEFRALNGRFQLLAENLSGAPEVAIRYFRPDLRKSGGSYETAVGVVKRIDACERLIFLRTGEKIPMDDVCALEGALFERLGLPDAPD